MSFTKVAPAGIGTEPGTSILIGDSLLHSTGIDIGSNTGIGVTIRKHGDATFTGIITASAFFGDGSGLEGVSSSGIGTALNDDDTNVLNKIYYVNQELSIGSTVTVNHPDTGTASYTHYQDLVVKDDADFIVAEGDTFIPDILGITTSTLAASSATGGRIRAGTITNAGANGAPNFPNGLTGTAATFTTATITNLGIAGLLTYEDVTNIDSVGVVTARSGIKIGPTAGVAGTFFADGSYITAGIITAKTGSFSGTVTANSFSGDGSSLTGIDATQIVTGNTSVQTVDTGSDGHIKFTTEGTERLRIHANGRIEPKYSSSAGATGGIMMVGAFYARPSAQTGEGIVQAKTDTNANCFDAAGWYNNTNYRYTPQVKGHYQLHGTGMMYTGMNGNSCEQSIYFIKNGSAGGGIPQYATGYSTNYGNYDLNHISNVIYMNGTTDYLTFYLASNQSVQIHSASCWSGFLLYPAA